MTRLEYQLLQEKRPDLHFPRYWQLSEYHQGLLEKLSEDRVIARRTAVILSRESVPDPDNSIPPMEYET